MNKKTITLVALGLALAAITYVTYNSLSQLNDIDYNLFEEDLEEDND
jgi:biopolymer transport protein ExbB/TolQ